MADFFVSYTLNGPNRYHAEMDDHIRALGSSFVTARLLETTWYIVGPTNRSQLHAYMRSKLSARDPLLVIEPLGVSWSNLPVNNAAFKASIENSALAA